MKTIRDILSYVSGGKSDVFNAVVHYRLTAGKVEIIEAFEIETELEKGFIHTICHTETGGRGHSFSSPQVEAFYSIWRKTNKPKQLTGVNEMLQAAYKKYGNEQN